MKKSKIDPENVLNDIQEVLNLIDELEKTDLEKVNTNKLEKKAKTIEKRIKENYPDYLDSEK